MSETVEVVDSVEGYLTAVREMITKKQSQTYSFEQLVSQYVFRGVGDAVNHRLESSAKRAILGKSNNRIISEEELKDYVRFQVEGYREKGLHHREGRDLSPFEILAEIQHFGGKTPLIDFTKNALVGLFFAVANPNHDDVDGRVFFTDLLNHHVFRKLRYEEAHEENLEKFLQTIFPQYDNIEEVMSRGEYNLNNYYRNRKVEMIIYWEAGMQNNRIPAQHSVFIIDKPVLENGHTFSRIDVDKSSKKKIRFELQRLHNLSNTTLFGDSQGYAKGFHFDGDLSKLYQAKVLVQNGEVVSAKKNIDSLKGQSAIISKYIEEFDIDFRISSETSKYTAENMIRNNDINLAINEYKIAVYLSPNIIEAKDIIDEAIKTFQSADISNISGLYEIITEYVRKDQDNPYGYALKAKLLYNKNDPGWEMNIYIAKEKIMNAQDSDFKSEAKQIIEEIDNAEENK